MRRRDRGAEWDRCRGPRCVASRESVKRRRSIAVRRSALLAGSAIGSLDAFAGDTSALTVGGVDVLGTVSRISARTSASLLIVVVVSFDIDAAVIFRESVVLSMVVVRGDEGGVSLSLIMRRDRASGR